LDSARPLLKLHFISAGKIFQENCREQNFSYGIRKVSSKLPNNINPVLAD